MQTRTHTQLLSASAHRPWGLPFLPLHLCARAPVEAPPSRLHLGEAISDSGLFAAKQVALPDEEDEMDRVCSSTRAASGPGSTWDEMCTSTWNMHLRIFFTRDSKGAGELSAIFHGEHVVVGHQLLHASQDKVDILGGCALTLFPLSSYQEYCVWQRAVDWHACPMWSSETVLYCRWT